MVRAICLFVMMLFELTSASVVTYDGDVFPEAAGWERITFLDCDRTLQDGWFCQSCGLAGSPGPIGETDYYQRSLSPFTGNQVFFIEWRVGTNIPSALFEESGVGTVLSAFGRSGTNYHFTMTDTRARLIRDNLLPITYVDFDSAVPHTYRLELYADERYEWYVDAQLVDCGLPEGAFPANDSKLIWGARHNVYENDSCWDYISYGLVPEPAAGLLLLIGAAFLAGARRRRRA